MDDMVNVRVLVVSVFHESGNRAEIFFLAPNKADEGRSGLEGSCDISERGLMADKDRLGLRSFWLTVS